MYPRPPQRSRLYLPNYRYPYSVELLDVLVAGRPGYLSDEDGRPIDWTMLATDLNATERAVVYAVEQLRHLEVYGSLDQTTVEGATFIGHCAALACVC